MLWYNQRTANHKQTIKDRDDFIMKPKGIWIAICMILSIGIFSTDYIKKRTGMLMGTDLAIEAFPEFVESSATQTNIQPRSSSLATISAAEAALISESM